MANKIGSLIIDLQGKILSSIEQELLAHPLVGGVILFARNYESREQLQHLCQQIRASRPQPLLIMVDQEGGRVQRFISEFTRLPSFAQFGILYDRNTEAACGLIKDCAWLMAVELLSVGIDLSLSPVLDLNKGVSSVIGQRAFHADSQAVITMACAFVQGMREAGMAATGKHFPGHGSVALDSHVDIPVDRRNLSEIEQTDMIPFAAMIKAGISAIMAAHIVFPNVDTAAVGFSSRWLKDILRNQLQFNGAIFSDDLSMEGANISANYADRVSAAREAGCDFTLLCNNQGAVIKVLDTLSAELNSVSQEKWCVLQGRLSPNQAYKENQRWQKTHEILSALDISPA